MFKLGDYLRIETNRSYKCFDELADYLDKDSYVFDPLKSRQKGIICFHNELEDSITILIKDNNLVIDKNYVIGDQLVRTMFYLGFNGNFKSMTINGNDVIIQKNDMCLVYDTKDYLFSKLTNEIIIPKKCVYLEDKSLVELIFEGYLFICNEINNKKNNRI